MQVKPIRSERDYQAALAQIERLFDANIGSEEADMLDVLTTLVEAYEQREYPIYPPDPVAAIEYYMESRGLTRQDIEPLLGSRARVSEVLGRKRPLSLRMIRNLQAELGIPANVLIQPYELV
ncbi:MAG: hypothetical protein KDE56_11905 [Anaerolineales bacterium]|nr:hypothetical protein [Anaerolineales bacterium]